MKNEKLRNYLFETICETKTWYGIILNAFYNDPSYNFPAGLVVKAHQALIEEVMSIEGIKWEDVVKNK